MTLNYIPNSQLLSSNKSSVLKYVYRWWLSMSDDTVTQQKENVRPAPTVFRAELKRAARLDDVYLTQGFSALWQSLPEEFKTHNKDWAIVCIATVAKTLAQVRIHQHTQRFAQSLGAIEKGADKPVVSELRFQSLQAAKTEQEFSTQLSRIINQLNNQTNILSLADDIACWFEEHHHFAPRRAEKRIAVRWAMDYYSHSPANA